MEAVRQMGLRREEDRQRKEGAGERGRAEGREGGREGVRKRRRRSEGKMEQEE